jgi:hypothetical protein
MLRGKGWRHQQRRRRAAGRRAGLEARERTVEMLRLHHFLERDRRAQQRERVVRRMPPRLNRDHPEHCVGRAVALLIIEPRPAELLRDQRRAIVVPEDRLLPRQMVIERAFAIVEHRAERAGQHLLEPEGEHALRHSALDRLAREEQGGRSGRAIIVDVDDRNPGGANAVQRRLARGRIGIDIAGIGLLDLLIAHARILKREADRLFGHHVPILALAGLGEGDHADPGDARPGHYAPPRARSAAAMKSRKAAVDCS